MYRHLFRIFILFSLGFAALEGAGNGGDIKQLYKQVLKSNYEQIAPLKEAAKKRQNAYIFSAIFALVIFAIFVKFYKAPGALVAFLMIGAGIYYLKQSEPKIDIYKEAFGEKILTPIGKQCCGFVYKRGKITRQEVEESGLFAPRIKSFEAKEGIFEGNGVRFGYVRIIFDTHENESVERFAENEFEGYVIELNRPNTHKGVLVSERLKQSVADIDPEFSAFFSKLPRKGKSNGFEVYGDVPQQRLDQCYPLADKEVGIAFLPHKTILFLSAKQDDLDPSVYGQFDLKSAPGYRQAFQKIANIVKACH